MRAAHPGARRLRRHAGLGGFLAVSLLLVLGACSKGANQAAPATTPPTAAAAAIPTYQVSASKFTFQGMPATVPANKRFNIVFSNKESFPITHELVVLGIPQGKSLQDVIADAKKKGPDGEEGWPHYGEIADVDTGATGVHTFSLPPGNYAITCWEDGKAGGGTGPVHASIGMAKQFTATTSASVPQTESVATYRVSAQKFTFQGMPSTVPANTPFNIVLANKESFAIHHELVVLALPDGKSAQDVIADAKKKGADAESDWTAYGEIEHIQTGATGVHTFSLPPGKYALTCWEDTKAGGGTGPVHASIGMVKGFTAATSASAQPAPAIREYQVSAQKFTFNGMPSTVPANTPFTVVFSNKESFPIVHELVVLGIPQGKSLQDVIADAKKKGPDGEEGWPHYGEIADVDTGATGVATFSLPPGTYAITCWEDGKAGGGTGPVHASIGMAKQFTVS